MKLFRLLAPLALMVISGSAFAHPGHGDAITSGFAHPFTGIDHLLAMLAVGIWAVQQREASAFWKIPLAFVAAMTVGGVLGYVGVALPHVESAIALSVLLLGLLVAFAYRLDTTVAMGVVALFALFHGYAHTSEAPLATNPFIYAAGFVFATAALHACGALLGYVVRNRAEVVLRAGGLGVAAVGAWLALG